MKGRHRITVYNARLRYEFEIKRNITMIQGDSGTGKTTLIAMLRLWENLGEGSGVDLVCDVPVTVLEGNRWLSQIREIHQSIVFIDEENSFIRSYDFAREVQNSSNYYVLMTRESLPFLPYSVEEIYGIHTSGKYHDTKQTYQMLHHIYPIAEMLPLRKPDVILTEDSHAGFAFFLSVAKDMHASCLSKSGKSRIIDALKQIEGEIIVVADGAAIGPEMNRLSEYVKGHPNVHLYLPESFEWLFLKSGIIDGKRIQMILDASADYIDSKRYFSWEQFFTELLIAETKDTVFHYKKEELNPAYLHGKYKNEIMKVINWIH